MVCVKNSAILSEQQQERLRRVEAELSELAGKTVCVCWILNRRITNITSINNKNIKKYV